MGRGRKPLKAQTGNLTVADRQEWEAEEKNVTTDKKQLKTAPKWLADDAARKEWRRIIKELDKIDLIGNLDRNNLAGYCNAFAGYVKVTEELKSEECCIKRETRTGTIMVRNPKVDVQKLYAEEMRRFAALCGLTIDARLKAAAIRTSKEQDEIEEKFGI